MTEISERYIPSGFFQRAAAFLIDRALLWTALLFIRIPAALVSVSRGTGASPVFFTFTVKDIVCWALITVYFVLFTWLNGATLGKKALHLRVLTSDGQRLSFGTALYREVIGRYLSSILCIGYLFCLGDKWERTLHDRICDTVVVLEIPEDAPLPDRSVSAAVPELSSAGSESNAL